MLTPLIDSRTKQDLLQDIGRRAPFYTPEWRYHPEEPDAGTALAFLWADMLSGVIHRYNRVLENYRRTLLDAVGSEPQPPLPARSYLCFEVSDEAGDVVVPAGTAVGSPIVAETALVTARELWGCKAKILAIYYTDPVQDVCRCYDSLEKITLFDAAEAGEHLWTLSHPYAFDLSPGALLRLEIEGNLTGEEVHWQFEDAGTWRDFLSVGVDGNAVLLRFPDEPAEKCTAIRFVLKGNASPQTLSAIQAFPYGAELAPQAVYAVDAQAAEAGFYPFGRRFAPYDCLYFSCDEALSKPGAVVELSFDLRMEETPIEGYLQPEIIWKRVMKYADLQPPTAYEVSIADTAWEYYNGFGWALLPLENQRARTVFATGRKSLVRYTLSFICPDDIRTVAIEAHDALFIRARVMSVDNLFRTNGHYLTPWMERPRFSYAYEQGIHLETALVSENLDTREVLLAGPVEVSGRVFENPAVCLAFDMPFTYASLLFQFAANVDAPELLCEYYSEKGWTELELYDETGSFGRTGLLSYHAPLPAAKLRLMGRDAWWIRFTDTAGAYRDPARTKPLLINIYENAVSAQARTPGQSANLPGGAYQTMISPLPGIVSAFNPLPAFGGCDGEDEDRIMRRLTAAFNHGDRAVSRLDQESLAREASLQVLRCRCVPFTGANGLPALNESCLVVLQQGGPEQQGNFSSLAKRISRFLQRRRCPAFGGDATTHIVPPHFIAVNIILHGGISGAESSLALKNNILAALARYLDPISGGADEAGWEIGVLPSPMDLSRKMQGITERLFVQAFDVTYTRVSESGGTILDYRDAAADRFALPVNGLHEIQLQSFRQLRQGIRKRR